MLLRSDDISPLYKLGSKPKAALGSPDLSLVCWGFAFAVALGLGSVTAAERAMKGMCVLHLCMCIRFKTC